MTNKKDNRGGKRVGKSKPHDSSKKPKFSSKGQQKKTANKASGASNEIRLNKYIANSGMCSRREADMYITTGNVQVNGQVVTELGYRVKLTDEVKFDGQRISPEKKTYVLLNKPKGFDTSNKEETFHKSARSLIANASNYHLVPIGTMQRNAMGLLLFTNDHDMQKKLTDSGLAVRKIYQVTLEQPLKLEDLQKIEEGIYIDRKKVNVDEISYIENAPKTEIGIQIKSSRHNIVKKLFESLNYTVTIIDRVSYAGLTKKDLPRGHWRHLTKQEVINLTMM